MSYINDPREMAIRPESGVTLEQDNRIETMYHWGAMVTDLCDMPVEEYMKPMTVIGLGGGGETPDTGTTIYTLKFMIDGVVVAQESLASGDPIPFSVNAEKENRTFLGWYYGSTPYTEGALMPSKNLTLSAKYECNVSFVFVVEGNEEIVSAYSVSYNTKLSNVPSTNKPGYKFIGWEPNTASTIVEHTVFKATFEPIIYIVTWSGYTDGVLTQEYRYKDKLIQPINPEKEGYTFTGWDKDIPKEVTSNLSFNAKFTINKYRIDYFIMINGDEGEPVSSMTLNYNSIITAKKIPSLTGYTFTEWAGYNAETNEPFNGTKMPAFDVKYVSTRTPNTYYLSYYDNDEHIITQDYKYKDLIIPYTYEKIGWTVSEWDNLPETMPYHNVSAHCTSTINQYEVVFKTNDGEVIAIAYPNYGTQIVNILPKIEGKTYVVSDDVLNSTVLENMVIYGDLIVNNYEVTFIIDGNEEKVVKLPYESSVDNYVVENFIPKEGHSLNYEPMNVTVPSNNDLVVNITYVPNKWVLTYETFGGDDNNISGEMTVEYDTKILSVLPETTIEGYNFDGWFDGVVKIDENTTMPDNDLYVHGNYNVITYVVVVKDGDFNFEKEYRHGTLLSEVLSEKEIVEHIEALSAVGYTGIFKLDGKDVDNSMEIKSNLEIQIERIPNEYVLTFTNDGNVISSALTPFGSVIVYPEMPGYTENGVEYIFIWDDNSYNGKTMPAMNLPINGKYQEKAEAPIYFGSYVIPTSAYSDDNISKYYDESQLNTPYYDSIMAAECVGNGSLIVIFMPGYEPFANLSDRNAAKEAKNYYQPPVFIVPINVVDKYNINVIDGVGGDQWPNFITDKTTLTINGNDYYFYSRIPNDTLTPGKYDNSDLKVTLKLTEK